MTGIHRSGRPTLISWYVQSYFCFLCKQHINAAPTPSPPPPPPCSLQKARPPLLASWCLAMKHPLTVLTCCQTWHADVFHRSRVEKGGAAQPCKKTECCIKQRWRVRRNNAFVYRKEKNVEQKLQLHVCNIMLSITSWVFFFLLCDQSCQPPKAK